jgi:glutathione S-transferase
MADIVADTLVPSAAMFGISLEPYPNLNAWIDSPFGEAIARQTLRYRQRLSQRESFRRTAPTPEGVQAALPTIKKILETR